MANIKFIKTGIKINKKNATLEIPLNVVKELYGEFKPGEKKTDMFISVVGGVLQASAKIPDAGIPHIILDKQYFVPKKN
jgi:hypothetical protein